MRWAYELDLLLAIFIFSNVRCGIFATGLFLPRQPEDHIRYKPVSNSRCTSLFVFRLATIDIHHSTLFSFFPASLTFFCTSSTHSQTTLWWIWQIYPCCCRSEIKNPFCHPQKCKTISFLKAKKCQEGWKWC